MTRLRVAFARAASRLGGKTCVAVLAALTSLPGCQLDAPRQALESIPTFACNSPATPGQPQFVIGYGSLMQDESRKRTTPEAGAAYPIRVSGFRRGWFARGAGEGFETTYLGATPDAARTINAVLYQIKDAADLVAIDAREAIYCRLRVDGKGYRLLAPETPPVIGDVWIYVSLQQTLRVAEVKFPIVQSYVDVFLSGCLEQEARFHLSGFASECIASTTDWSTHWINDRIYPRRPHLYQPKARQIDTLIHDELPAYFRAIRLDSGSLGR